jgi:hypothetical protein
MILGLYKYGAFGGLRVAKENEVLGDKSSIIILYLFPTF